MEMGVGVDQCHGLARRRHLEASQIGFVEIQLPQVRRVWVHKVNDLHLTVLRGYKCCSGHAGMHANKGCTGMEGDWR